MDKYLFNDTDEHLEIKSLGVVLEEHNEYEIPYAMAHLFIENEELLEYIRNSIVLVGTAGSLIMDPLEGEAFFRTQLGDQAFVSDEETVQQYDNITVQDPFTGKKAVAFFMNMLTMMRDLYNDESNPVYFEGHEPILGENGWAETHLAAINNLNTIHSKLGWHRQEIYSYVKNRPLDLLIYYGYLNSFNSAVNGWDNELVAQDMAKYNLIVFGDGVAYPEHPDYENTEIIISRIKALNPLTKIFGYISVNLEMEEFGDIAGAWNELEVDGIFFDEAGYDYGLLETNGREALNEKIDFVHSQEYTKLCFINAWNMDHIIGIADDPNYPNEEYNPHLIASRLNNMDWYLLESFAVNTLAYGKGNGYALKEDWAMRGLKAQGHRNIYGINLASVGVINNDNEFAQDYFNFAFISALMWSLEANGTSDNYYGSGAAVNYWERPSISEMGRIWNLNASVQEDKDNYLRYVDHGRFKLVFEEENQLSEIVKY